MKAFSKRFSRLLAILPLAALAADNNPTNTQPALPEPVAAAVAAADCEQLIALNQRYHQDAAAAGRLAATAALEDAILALPSCGQIDAALVRVELIRGIDFFDRERPLGDTAQGR